MAKLTTKEWVLLVIGAIALIVILALTGVLLYTLSRVSETTLRWWAGVATLTLPLVALAAYFLGRIEARGWRDGLTQGIEAVSEAARKTTDVAQRTADIRVTTAQRMKRSPTPVVQQMFLPPAVTGMGTMGATGVILPPQRAEGDVEI